MQMYSADSPGLSQPHQTRLLATFTTCNHQLFKFNSEIQKVWLASTERRDSGPRLRESVTQNNLNISTTQSIF